MSSTVTLDREALRRAGHDLDSLRVADLTPSGWTFERKRLKDGGVSFVLARRVSSDVQAQTALHQLGPPFASLRVIHGSSWLHAQTTVSGIVDLRTGLDAFSDPALRTTLGTSIDDLFELSGVGPTQRRPIRLAMQLSGANQIVALPIGKRTPVNLVASSWRFEWIYIAIGILCLGGGARLLGSGRRKTSTPEPNAVDVASAP